MAIVLIAAILGAGVFFFWLHSLPERMVHHRLQFDVVASLALLSLFTHIHAFWVAALLLALIKFPDPSEMDFVSPLTRIAGALERVVSVRPDKQIDQRMLSDSASVQVKDVCSQAVDEIETKREQPLKRF
jgi:hypothetical protein